MPYDELCIALQAAAMLFAGQSATLAKLLPPVPALEGGESLSQQQRLAPVQRCYAAAVQLQPRGGSGSCGVLRAQSTTLAYMMARAAQNSPPPQLTAAQSECMANLAAIPGCMASA